MNAALKLFKPSSLDEYEQAGKAAGERLAAAKSSGRFDAFDSKLSELFRDRAGRPKMPREPEMPFEYPPCYEFLVVEMRNIKKKFAAMWRLGYRTVKIDGSTQQEVEWFEDNLPFDRFCVEQMENEIQVARTNCEIPNLNSSHKTGLDYHRNLLEYALLLAMHGEEDATRFEFREMVLHACNHQTPLSPDRVLSDTPLELWVGELSRLAARMANKGGVRRKWGMRLQEWLGDSVDATTEKLKDIGFKPERVLRSRSRQPAAEMYGWRGKRDVFERAMQDVERVMGTPVVDLCEHTIDAAALATHLERFVSERSNGIIVDELVAQERAATRAGPKDDIPLIGELEAGMREIGHHGVLREARGGGQSEPKKRPKAIPPPASYGY